MRPKGHSLIGMEAIDIFDFLVVCPSGDKLAKGSELVHLV
jgi:hypothetical protein